MDLTERDLERLDGVHPHLIGVVKNAAMNAPVEFFVIQGVRTLEEQKAYVATGKSQTMNSRHLGGFAVDLGIKINDQLTWEHKYYLMLADTMLASAAKLKVALVWGGSWKTLKDDVHFELNHMFYPDIVVHIPRKEIP